eukprot:Mycagemm_TRINITY_DN8364_c0_g1::TRINITY_DN8364_c0_g1_i2::g.5530::m.5530 type:complete len:479 gc:universal TRINITY_DN8364_c0_g1_i2:200-1636(+)
MSKKEGQMGGSLLITEVNGKRLTQPLVIYGTPKLAYPYQSTEAAEFLDFSQFTDASSCYFGNKWDGTNVLFFRYADADGNEFISAKTKGTAFLSDSQHGAFLTLTMRAMKLRKALSSITPKNLPLLLKQFGDARLQSKSFELCGTDEPHLVAYDFAVELKPLFLTYNDGSIAPAVNENPEDVGPVPFNAATLAKECRSMQASMLQSNEAFRAKKGLPHRYERAHFAVEGRVLYLLDANGRLLKRTMYKVKPSDVEEVHWASFDSTMHGRVREAVEKLRLREKSLSNVTMQEELDMGPKGLLQCVHSVPDKYVTEWARFGKEVMVYATRLGGAVPLVADDKRRVMFVCGQGESAAATQLAAEGWVVLVADSDAPHALLAALKKGSECKVVVCAARTAKSRAPWLRVTQELGVLRVESASFAQSDKGPSKREGFSLILVNQEPYRGQKAEDLLALFAATKFKDSTHTTTTTYNADGEVKP